MAGMTDLFNLKKWERSAEKVVDEVIPARKQAKHTETSLKGDGRSGRSASRSKAAAPVVKPMNKSVAAYRTISEVAAELGVATHVLRFWESKFPVIKPLKKSGGRRYYRPEDIALLRHIQDLLYKQGYTIKGVQAHLNKTKKRDLQQAVQSLTAAQVVQEIRAVRDLLQSGLGQGDDQVQASVQRS